MIGSQEPRIEVIPDGDEHPRWAEVLEFLDRLGLKLDPWQERILRVSLLRKERDEPLEVDGVIHTHEWAARRIGVCCPRQNGKNVILAARQLIGAYLLAEKMVIHSAHLADTSMEHFRFLDNLLDANEWMHPAVKHIRRQNGHEQITFANRCRIRFRTRTSGGGRGFSGSPLGFDEAMYLSAISYAAMRPMISAQPDPQVWLTGSAVDQRTMPDGLVFARLRENALAGITDDEEGSIAFFEWSLDYATPDDVPSDEMMTERAMALTNPAFGRRITRKTILEELADFPTPRMAAVERYGVGDWPKTDGIVSVIDLELWERLADAKSHASLVTFAFDVRPDRSRAVICAVGRRADGHLHLELVDQREGVGWLVPRLVELEQRHNPLGIVCDGVGPASSIIPELVQQQVEMTVLDTSEVGQACGMFYDAVQEERVRHLGQPELLHAIKGAAQRPLGDRWAWSRRNSTSDISPLVACTLGVWKVVTEEQSAPMFAFG